MMDVFADILQSMYSKKEKAKLIAEKIRSIKNYSSVGLYDVNEKDISILASTGTTGPAYPVFPKPRVWAHGFPSICCPMSPSRGRDC